MERKTITFYRREVYGRKLEYVADKGDAACIVGLTGTRTIDARTRELLRDLTGGFIQWKEVLAP